MPGLLAELAALGLALACAAYLLRAYAHQERAGWSGRFGRQPRAVLWLLLFATLAAKLGEDVIAGEAGPIDRRLLLYLHAQVPPAWHGFFAAITWTGSARVLLPLTAAAATGLLLARRARDAILLAGSVAAGALLVFAIKSLVARPRPALWVVGSYWGSSFPSGHTLLVTAFATAASLLLARAWPAARGVTFALAAIWIVLVGVSRLVLGVHWPSDVLVAACLGAALPLAVAIAMDRPTAPARPPAP